MSGGPVPPLRLGLIGCGAIAFWVHLRNLRRMRDVVLVAAADPDEAARARTASLTPAHLVAEPAAVLERTDIEAVLIAAPTELHAELAVAAARSGKHVYLEKPVATDWAGARRVEEAVAAAGVTAVMGFNRRFHPAHRRARELIVGGRIGRVRAVQSIFAEAAAGALPMWKTRRESGGGVLLDLASHHFDLLRWMLGAEAVSVKARTWSEATAQDTAAVWLSFDSGVEAHGYFSFHSGVADHLEFFGDSGRIRVDRHATAPELWLSRRLGYGVRRSRVSMPVVDQLGRIRRWMRPAEDPSYFRALRAFVARIRGATDDAATLGDGARSLDLVLAAEVSASADTTVSLPPIPRGG